MNPTQTARNYLLVVNPPGTGYQSPLNSRDLEPAGFHPPDFLLATPSG